MSTRTISSSCSIESPSTFCKGVGCVLRDRCQHYVYGQSIDLKASGFVWLMGSQDDDCDEFLPVVK